MLSWNSWYNPFDNVASAGKSMADTLTGFAYGSQQGAQNPGPAQEAYYQANNSAGQHWQDAVGGFPKLPSIGGGGGGNPGGGGGGGGQVAGTYTAPAPAYTPPPDPYAQWGGKAAFDQLVSGFDQQKQGIHETSTEALRREGGDLGLSIIDYINSLKAGQQKIDNKRINNMMAKTQGGQDIQSMVGRGIQSGGVMLANKNAADSSAAGAIARAYGNLGQREMSKVGNQYALGELEADDMQAQFTIDEAQGARRIRKEKQDILGGVVDEARNALAILDAQMAGASLPDRINLEAEKGKVRQRAVNMLAKYDTQLAQGRGGVNPMGRGGVRSEAGRRSALGRAPAEMFEYTTEIPAEFQGTGPFAGNLPIFTLPGNRRREE